MIHSRSIRNSSTSNYGKFLLYELRVRIHNSLTSNIYGRISVEMAIKTVGSDSIGDKIYNYTDGSVIIRSRKIYKSKIDFLLLMK